VTVPERFTCQIPIGFDPGSTAADINTQISCSISTVEFFEINSNNTFFGLSRIAAIKFADFRLSFISTY
jgi:hypothetical protein